MKEQVQLEKTRMLTIAEARIAIDICTNRARQAIENKDYEKALSYVNIANIAARHQQGQINWCVAGDSKELINKTKKHYDL